MEKINLLFQSQPFSIAFVIGTYLAALWLYRKTQLALLHPVLTSIGLIILILKALSVSYSDFKQGSQLIDFMLGPSVVALGFILYEQVEAIKANLVSMMTAIFVGSVMGIASVIAIAKAMGANHMLIATLEPKSVTTPIAVGISEQFGGITSLTAVVVIAVGIFGGIVGPFILNKFNINSKIARGLALGASAHGLGTARAIELGAIEGAISGLAIGLMGIATALLVPVFEVLFSLGIFTIIAIQLLNHALTHALMLAHFTLYNEK